MILLYMTGNSILTLQINNSEEAVSVNRIFFFSAIAMTSKGLSSWATGGEHEVIAVLLPFQDPHR
jgi:hypothetical protein